MLCIRERPNFWFLTPAYEKQKSEQRARAFAKEEQKRKRGVDSFCPELSAPITKPPLRVIHKRLVHVDCYAPGSFIRDDQKGCSDSVEQAHCTLGAVKRYRALSEGGGLPNF